MGGRTPEGKGNTRVEGKGKMKQRKGEGHETRCEKRGCKGLGTGEDNNKSRKWDRRREAGF